MSSSKYQSIICLFDESIAAISYNSSVVAHLRTGFFDALKDEAARRRYEEAAAKEVRGGAEIPGSTD